VCYSVGVVNFWWVSCLDLKVAWCGVFVWCSEKCSLENIALIQVLCVVQCFFFFFFGSFIKELWFSGYKHGVNNLWCGAVKIF